MPRTGGAQGREKRRGIAQQHAPTCPAHRAWYPPCKNGRISAGLACATVSGQSLPPAARHPLSTSLSTVLSPLFSLFVTHRGLVSHAIPHIIPHPAQPATATACSMLPKLGPKPITQTAKAAPDAKPVDRRLDINHNPLENHVYPTLDRSGEAVSTLRCSSS